jgi:PKD repeat protein
MKKIILLVAVASSFFIFNLVFSANTDIVINEIYDSSSATQEWIEIWNKGNDPVEITSGWQYLENNTTTPLIVSSNISENIITPKSFGILCHDKDIFSLNFSFSGPIFEATKMSLLSGGEEIGLLDNNSVEIEKFTYPDTGSFSLERIDPYVDDYTGVNWVKHPTGHTVGLQNLAYSHTEATTTTPTSTPDSEDDEQETSTTTTNWANIKINEFVSDPADGNEWVELYNTGSSTEYLSGGFICDNRDTTSTCKNLSSMISPFSFLVFDIGGSSYLNNDGDSVVLTDANFNIIDSVAYGVDGLPAPEKGESVARSIDGAGSWAVTTKITSGAANEIIAPVVPQSGGGGGGSGGGSYASQATQTPATTATSTAKTTKTAAKSTTSQDPVKIIFNIESPYSLAPNEVGGFSAFGTVDPRGGDVFLSWDFGDGATSTGVFAAHSFATSGVYSVVLSASSTAGTKTKKEFDVIVGKHFSLAAADIRFFEIFPESKTTGEEFIVLKNFASTTQNISGWKIKNKAGKEFEIPVNTEIIPSSTLKFFRFATHLDFDKDGDEARLFSPNNILMDSMKVNAPAEEAKKEGEKKSSQAASVAKSQSKQVYIGAVANSMALARDGEKGQRVKVRGTVAVLPQIFGKQYFYIFDGASGIQIYNYKKEFPEIKVGDLVEVSGEITFYGNVVRVKTKSANDVDVLSVGNALQPTVLSLEEIGDESVGALVRIAGDITEIKSNFMYVDDGTTEAVVYFKQGAKIDKSKFSEGESVEVVGVAEFGTSGIQIWPRGNSDIKSTGFSKEYLSKKQVISASGLTTAETYATATAGGLTTLLFGLLARARGAIVVGAVKKTAGLAVRLVKRG